MENHIILWIWIISATFDIIWYQRNSEFLKSYHERNFQGYDFNSYLTILIIATIIIAPIIFISIITGEIRLFTMVSSYKRKLNRKLRKLDDKEVAKFLKEELDKIKP